MNHGTLQVQGWEDVVGEQGQVDEEMVEKMESLVGGRCGVGTAAVDCGSAVAGDARSIEN